MQVLDATPALIEGHPHQFDKWRANAQVERRRNLGRRQTSANTRRSSGTRVIYRLLGIF